MKKLYLIIALLSVFYPIKSHAFTDLTEELSKQNLEQSKHIFQGCVRSEETYVENTDKSIPDIIGDSRLIKVEVSEVLKGDVKKGDLLEIIIAGSGVISLHYRSRINECRLFLINEEADGSLHIGWRSSQLLIKKHLEELIPSSRAP